MTLRLLKPGDQPDPEFSFETRPSEIGGFQTWAVLRYKQHLFEELVPAAVIELVGFDEAMTGACIRLQLLLKPILIEEDAPAFDGALSELDPLGADIDDAAKP